jgi:hypothetical protein
MNSTGLDSGAGKWQYEDDVLEWDYSGNTIIAAIDPDTPQIFTLETATGWTREDYFLVSTSTKSRSASQYREILRKSLGQTEMDNFDSTLNKKITLGAVTMEIPFYWVGYGEDDNTYYAELYGSENSDDYALETLILYLLDVKEMANGKNMEQVNSYIESEMKEIWYSTFKKTSNESEQVEITKDPYMIYPNGNVGVIGSLTTTNEKGISVDYTTALIYNEESYSCVFCVLATAGDTIFLYDTDFEKALNSISVSASAQKNSSASTKASSSASNSTSKSSSTAGVTPELKEFLDSYEAYMDEYVAFMEKYKNADDPISMMSDYMAMLQEYIRLTQALDEYDTKQMSDADLAYYLEVTTRVTQKLLAGSLQ